MRELLGSLSGTWTVPWTPAAKDFALSVRECALRAHNLLVCAPSIWKSWIRPCVGMFISCKQCGAEICCSNMTFLCLIFQVLTLLHSFVANLTKFSLLLRSHLHVKLSRKSHERQFLRKGMGRGHLVAVTGCIMLNYGITVLHVPVVTG